jgi:hypothetical protein
MGKTAGREIKGQRKKKREGKPKQSDEKERK